MTYGNMEMIRPRPVQGGTMSTDPMLLQYLAENAKANNAVAEALRKLGDRPDVLGGFSVDPQRAERLRGAIIKTYDILNIDLTTARTNVKYGIEGTYIHAWTDGEPSTIGVRLNAVANDWITFDKRKVIQIPFVEFYLTNDAQLGKTLNLLIGKGGTWQGDQFSAANYTGGQVLAASQVLNSTAIVSSTFSPTPVQGWNEKTIFIKAIPSGSPGLLTCRVALSPIASQVANWMLDPLTFDPTGAGAQYQHASWTEESQSIALWLHAETGGAINTWTVSAWYAARR